MNNGLINIPHSSRMISQFELKDRGDDGSVFTGTGKVLCVCNCRTEDAGKGISTCAPCTRKP